MSPVEPADESFMGPDETTSNSAAAAGDSTTAAHDVADGGVEWTVTDEANPFHRRFAVAAHGAPVLDLLLDPLVVQDMLTALGQVNADQRRVLGLSSEPARAMALPSTEPSPVGMAGMGGPGPANDDTSDVAADPDGAQSADAETADVPSIQPTGGPLTLAWWWQHKLLAFLLLFAAVFAGIGALTGSG